MSFDRGGSGRVGRAMPAWVPRAPASPAARQSAMIFMGCGALLLAGNVFVPPDPAVALVVELMNLGAMLFGLLVWVLPWHRWHPRLLLVTVLAAFILIAVAEWVHPSPYKFGVFFVVIFGWAGLSQGRYACVALAPLAAVAYVAPRLITGNPGPGAIASTLTVIPVGVLIGEIIAAKVAQLTAARSESEHRANLLHAVFSASRGISTLDRSAVLRAVSHALGELGFAASSFTFLTPDGTRYRVEGARGLPAAYERGTHLLEGTLTAQVCQQRATVVIDDYSAQIAHPALQSERFGATIATPLWVAGELVGAMVASKPGRATFGAEDLEACELLAAQAGRALENVRTFQAEVAVRRQLSADSRQDALTGIGNRRHAMSLLESLRIGDAIALIDLDHFKAVNDTLGHAAGDAVLTEFGTFLKRTLRDGDDVARYGGEEFLLLLRNAGDEAATVLERLTGDWRRLGGGTTFSTGYAVHARGAEPAQTLAFADDALYAAKAAGRDCVRAG